MGVGWLVANIYMSVLENTSCSSSGARNTMATSILKVCSSMGILVPASSRLCSPDRQKGNVVSSFVSVSVSVVTHSATVSPKAIMVL
jgi:hypothetical protein